VANDDRMDVPAVLEQLNQALELQSRSALQYLLAAGGGQGTHALAVGEQLWNYTQAEFADARPLISKIVALGGEPSVQAAGPSYHKRIEDALDHLIETETEALAALHAVIPHTGQEPASEGLEHLIEHVIMRKQNQVDFLLRARA
jgi:bacterioferritin (cytochrome b1)